MKYDLSDLTHRTADDFRTGCNVRSNLTVAFTEDVHRDDIDDVAG